MITRNMRLMRTPRIRVLVLAVALLLCVVPAAYAAWAKINTNNSTVESLGVPFYTSTCSDPNVVDYLEIKNGWMVMDGDGFYFRLEACAQPAAGEETRSLRLGAGFDCTNDGDVLDGDQGGANGDRKAVYWVNEDQTWLYSGTNAQIVQMPDNSYGERIGANYEWWLPLDRLYANCRASTNSVGIGLATVKMETGMPVTKDETPLTATLHPIDYGDASNPDPQTGTCTQYPTRTPCNGARHGLNSPLMLGSAIDAEGGNLHGANADGDDTTNIDDEDGVQPALAVNWTAGGQGSVSATVTGGSGRLNCWIDWNNDKDWADTGERILSDVSVAAGANTSAFSVPAGVTYPNSFVSRCRLTPGAGQGTAVTGAWEFGEVEDHNWAFGATGNRPAPVTAASAVAAHGADMSISWSNVASNESYLVHRSPRPYFNPGEGDVTTTLDPDNSSPYVDPGIVGGAANTFFYRVQGQVTTSTPDLTSAPSNPVGLFEFSLTRGS